MHDKATQDNVNKYKDSLEKILSIVLILSEVSHSRDAKCFLVSHRAQLDNFTMVIIVLIETAAKRKLVIPPEKNKKKRKRKIYMIGRTIQRLSMLM